MSERPGTAPVRECPSEPGSLTTLRWALFVTATIVVAQAALGFAGVLAAAPVVLAILALAGVAATVTMASTAPGRSADAASVGRAPSPRAPWQGAEARAQMAGAAALTAALLDRAWAGLHRTSFLYDVLSYHLHLPAAWRAAGRLAIVPTPFGDPAPAYAPCNAELVYHLALAAAGNATLAHAGQLPFAALAALAIHATARQLGAARSIGVGAAAAFLLIPEVWQQAPTAMVDLALAAFFLAALPFLLRLEARRDRPWPDLAALGVALGLLVGTKYLATVLGLPLFMWTAVVLARRRPDVHRRSAVLLVGALALVCGGFWYVRNAFVTGNPLFPATLRLGPFVLARGLYDGTVIRGSEYHLAVNDLVPFAEMFAEAGWCWIAALCAGLAAAWRTRWPALFAAVALLFWFVVPYQQSRFLFVAWGLGAVALTAGSVRRPRLAVAALVAATAGAIIEFPTPGRALVLAAAAAGAALGPRLMALGAPFAIRPSAAGTAGQHAAGATTGATRLAAVGVVCAAATIAGAVAWSRTRTTGPPYAIGDHHDEGWRWINAYARNRRIAYTGSNVPLPLWGPTFGNDVRYVNVSGGPRAAPHDFLELSPPHTQAPTTPAPVTAESAEPAPERQHPDRSVWLANVSALRIDTLFVAALYPGVAATLVHDDDGFPVERGWADALPKIFTLAFTSPGIRIYQVNREAAR